jgi:hypothetical protein
MSDGFDSRTKSTETMPVRNVKTTLGIGNASNLRDARGDGGRH